MTRVVYYDGRLPIPSQDPLISNPTHREMAETTWLPVLVKIWMLIEAESGFAWHATSYWRRSPSHRFGCSLDIAPDIADKSKDFYAVYRRSDPVLYKREELIRILQRAVHKFRDPNFSVGVYIEPDHLHMQVYPFKDAMGRARLFKWKVPKLVYPDTLQRMKLPMITSKNIKQLIHNNL